MTSDLEILCRFFQRVVIMSSYYYYYYFSILKGRGKFLRTSIKRILFLNTSEYFILLSGCIKNLLMNV